MSRAACTQTSATNATSTQAVVELFIFWGLSRLEDLHKRCSRAPLSHCARHWHVEDKRKNGQAIVVVMHKHTCRPERHSYEGWRGYTCGMLAMGTVEQWRSVSPKSDMAASFMAQGKQGEGQMHPLLSGGCPPQMAEHEQCSATLLCTKPACHLSRRLEDES